MEGGVAAVSRRVHRRLVDVYANGAGDGLSRLVSPQQQLGRQQKAHPTEEEAGGSVRALAPARKRIACTHSCGDSQ